MAQLSIGEKMLRNKKRRWNEMVEGEFSADRLSHLRSTPTDRPSEKLLPFLLFSLLIN